MTPLTACLLTGPVTAAVCAAAAVAVARTALRGTESRHRAAILRALADVLRSLGRGRPRRP